MYELNAQDNLLALQKKMQMKIEAKIKAIQQLQAAISKKPKQSRRLTTWEDNNDRTISSNKEVSKTYMETTTYRETTSHNKGQICGITPQSWKKP